jgi:uncharacterized protein
MKVVDYIVLVLLIIGGLNWGLVGFFDVNVINGIFNKAPMIGRIIYALVGLAALYRILVAEIWSHWFFGTHRHVPTA